MEFNTNNFKSELITKLINSGFKEKTYKNQIGVFLEKDVPPETLINEFNLPLSIEEADGAVVALMEGGSIQYCVITEEAMEEGVTFEVFDSVKDRLEFEKLIKLVS